MNGLITIQIINMEEAIDILKHSEVVLMKKIKGLQDGKPKWAASEKLRQLRYAIDVLEAHNSLDEMIRDDADELLVDIFTQNPPKYNV
jgi:hypothetical protein